MKTLSFTYGHRARNVANGGMALVIALVFIMAALVILGTLSVRLMTEARQVTVAAQLEQCFQGAEAGLVRSRAELEAGRDGVVGLEQWAGLAEAQAQARSGKALSTIPRPRFDDPGVAPLELATTPATEYCALALNYPRGLDINGDGILDESATTDMYLIRSMARCAYLTREAEAVLRKEDVGPWNNALFAGTGHAGGTVLGSARICGSAHILGNAEGAPVLDLGDAGFVANTYEALPADLAAMIPPLDRTLIDGTKAATLEAVLRVREGRIKMDGGAWIGRAEAPGSSSKMALDGIFASAGWTGGAVADDGFKGVPANVYSDNGWVKDYDLDDRVPFPKLTDVWTDPKTGAKAQDTARNRDYTFGDYFDAVLVGEPDNPSDGIFTGDVTLEAGGASFYWNATTGQRLAGAAPATPPAATDDFLWYDDITRVLRVNGHIAIRGSLTFDAPGDTAAIHYSGRAAILVHGNVFIDADLLPCNNGDPANTASSFPAANALGVMAEDTLAVGMRHAPRIVGAFYAQRKAIFVSGATVLGAIMADSLDMGSNTPLVAQVPALAANLPDGMIGARPIPFFAQVAWREILR